MTEKLKKPMEITQCVFPSKTTTYKVNGLYLLFIRSRRERLCVREEERKKGIPHFKNSLFKK